MGGALILLSLLLPTVLWADLRNPFVLATTAVTAGYGVIGYLDDYLKIKRRSSGGLPGRYKLIGQVLIGGAAIAYVFLAHVEDARRLVRRSARKLALPFVAFSKHSFDLPLWVYIPFAVFVVVATSNAVNLTDGLDGLAIGPVMINAGTYLIWAYVAGATIAQLLARDLPRHPADRLGRRARRLLRLGHRRGNRLPLVQHLPGAGLHGGRGLARARRRARHARGLHQERAPLASCSAGSSSSRRSASSRRSSRSSSRASASS